MVQETEMRVTQGRKITPTEGEAAANVTGKNGSHNAPFSQLVARVFETHSMSKQVRMV
jgi:hypothetical protein